MQRSKTRYFIPLAAALILMASVISYAAVPSLQDRKTAPKPQQAKPTVTTRKERQKTAATPVKTANDTLKKINVVAQPLALYDDTIPDSLLHPRWKIQRTTALTLDDYRLPAADLKRPDNLKQQVIYNDTLNRYMIGTRIGSVWLSAPIIMTPEEYRRWSEQQARNQFFRNKNDEIYQAKGKEKFDFTDMHFDLGPAEKIFGPGGVRIKTQGSAELKLGATLKNIDNPSLPIRNRKTTTIDFDEKINLNVNGKVGDKVNLNLNYNTDATFDFDTQNLKLKYEGKEDEIVKLVEAGNVSFPSNSSLVQGASSLFGLRTDLQFGRLKLQMVASQKKSSSTSVSSKGGVQLTPFEINVANYEENMHFFLSQYFRGKYDAAMRTLPNITTGIKINRVEIWVTNKSGVATNTRNIVALTDLGENKTVSNPMWTATGQPVPANAANNEYQTMTTAYAAARDIDAVNSTLDGAGLVGGVDYEKLESARLLTSSEYTLNSALGYISLRTTLQSDQVLAVAYEYTYGGVTYQVGEFASDITDTGKALFVKSLKNTSNNPSQGNWDLMMKNVYSLASTIEKEKFRLDVKFQSDTAGVYLNYIPEAQVKETPIIRALGADRLDNNNKTNPNGYFDYVEGYTVTNGRVFFPCVEPFGSYMYNYLVSKGVSPDRAQQYAFTELYDTTKTVAKQIAEKNKYILVGQFKGSASGVISLGAYNVPQGSVVVTAGGVTLTEGTDYTVDYSAGEVTILNQSLLDAGTQINVSLESQSDYGQQRKTMFGLNWEYDFSKNLQLSGTIQHLSEQALTTKVNMGSEPLNNTLWGVNLNWKKESQWLTNMLDKLPFLHLTQPSQITFNAEFAQLIAGQSHGTQDNASYIDDFENTTSKIDISAPSSWIISSVPSMIPNYNDKTSLKSGYQRSLLAWYNIDPLFTRRSSSLTPAHIKSDLEQLSNHYVREVLVNELYPNRDQSSYNGAISTLSVLNLAFYPDERGPYNFNPDLTVDGKLRYPQNNWGGMMRKLNTNDFEAANIEYVEFWLMDPFIYTNQQADANEYGGDMYINLGEVSEDVLRDGKKFYESGMPVDGSQSYVTTQWGKVPTQGNVTYAFATTSGSRALQDVGFNGLRDEEERLFDSYQEFLQAAQAKVRAEVYDSIQADPANDDYHYFRGTDFDLAKTSILDRYKRINNPQGNSPDSESRTESYDTSYKTTPDVEDINQDYTLNEYEKYYQYRVSMRPQDMVVGRNYIVDRRDATASLRNGKSERVTWYQFRIPLSDYEERVGSITDFTSMRFMRVFLKGFTHPIVLRFGSLDLVKGEWRTYDQVLDASSSTSGKLETSSINIEENNDKTPVNYVLPPGINRSQDPTQPQLVEANEQALNMVVTNLGPNESKAVYKNTSLDLRQYRRLQMFVHANAMEQNTTELADNQMAVFIRVGSDYKTNYYEYEIPLKLTEAGHYDRYSRTDCERVWPEENMLDFPLSIFTRVKKERNIAKAQGTASYQREFSVYDADHPANRVSIVGNPTLGEVKTMMIGVRNKAGVRKSAEVWVNELRLQEYNNSGGWAAQGNLNVQLSDMGSVNMQGKYMTEGFGGLEQGVSQRSTDNYKTYSVTANLELGKFFPDKAKVSAPLYYSVTKEETSPKYNPLDTDMLLQDALDAAGSKQERDSINSIAVTKTTSTNFSLSNVKVDIQNKRHPLPIDPANFSLSYSHSHRQTSGETTVYEKEDNWRGAFNYNWTPVFKAWEPFKKLKNKSKWLDIVKRFGLNWLPQNVGFNTEITRSYYELQERDMDDLGAGQLPLTYSSQFLWNRDFTLRWDLTKNIHMNFQSATHAEIEEPNAPVNKERYPDEYAQWKDSVKTSLRHMGTPLDYSQSFTLSYQVPLNLIPAFDWTNINATYTSSYNWVRGTALDDGTSLGNNIVSNRDVNVSGTFNMVTLYNHIPFLKKANTNTNKNKNKNNTQNRKQQKNSKQQRQAKDTKLKATGKDAEAEKQKKELPKNLKSYEREVTLMPDSALTISHGKRTKRIQVTAKTKDGKPFDIKFKKINENKIKLLSKVDSATKVKITVTPLEPLEDKKWYKIAQSTARVLMMVRNISLSYRDNYSLSLPGFMPSVGNAFGQTRGYGLLSPGLDFAFGMVDDSYIDKAKSNDWLLINDSVATPATTNLTRDLQLRVTLEPITNLKIDLVATRNENRSKSIQYMYNGNPTTQSGTFSMTTISLKGALSGIGTATDGFHSSVFEKFCASLDRFRDRVEAQYANAVYPQGSTLAGKPFDPTNGTIDKYSADVMVPAFLSTYTSMGDGLDIFPSLARMLPNWTVKYSGLSKLPWFRDVFKSFNINHAYRSVYAVGSYSTYSTFQEFMNGLGFVTETTTGNPIPSSMFNVSSVSVNEAFSPLLGVDMTFQNNLTAKLEYRTTRVLNLSMTSVQLNEALSRDWVLGLSYRINNFKPFGDRNTHKVKNRKKGSKTDAQSSTQAAVNRTNGTNNDLNLKLDLSYRRQASISRDIATVSSYASSGNTAFKLSFMADYTLTRLLTLSFYYDRQTNTPLLASNSFPTTTRDFGLSVKFSLTR